MIPRHPQGYRCSDNPARAFKVFRADMGTWWPLHTHSLSGMAGQSARCVLLDPRLGGEIIETMADGSDLGWG